MNDPLQLGGNIELFGADILDPASMVVVKKIVGNYARKFSEKGLEKLSVTFTEISVAAQASVAGNVTSASSDHPNLFFGIDQALRDIESQL